MKVPVPVHSYNRTLLASLGFADPDRNERLHSLAARYLALVENRQLILDRFGFTARVADLPVKFESIITKGEGQYQTTIGFVDLILPYLIPHSCPGQWCCNPEPRDQWERASYGGLAVEVKIRPVDVTNIIRQINLYRTYYVPTLGWLAATAFRLPSDEADVLRSSGIGHIVLGDRFKNWVSSLDERNESGPRCIEI